MGTSKPLAVVNGRVGAVLDTARLVKLSAALISFALAVPGGGCFADPKTIVGGGETSGGQCAQGSLDCACYGNGTCDFGLRCAVEAGVCIPDDCAPGHRGCECADGACLSPLVCDAGICTDASSSAGESSTTDMVTSGETTVSTSSDTATVTTSPITDTGTTSEDSTTAVDDTSTSDESDSAGGCAGLQDCGACLACVSQPGEVCGGAYDECKALMGCVSAAACQADCALSGICPTDCCAGLTQGEGVAADSLSDCRGLACSSQCGRFDFPQCA